MVLTPGTITQHRLERQKAGGGGFIRAQRSESPKRGCNSGRPLGEVESWRGQSLPSKAPEAKRNKASPFSYYTINAFHWPNPDVSWHRGPGNTACRGYLHSQPAREEQRRGVKPDRPRASKGFLWTSDDVYPVFTTQELPLLRGVWTRGLGGRPKTVC